MARVESHRRGIVRRPLPQRVLVVGVRGPRSGRAVMESSLEELVRLVETAGGTVAARAAQEVRRPDPATFLGRGKVEELRSLAERAGADTVAVDWELSPVQNRNLEDATGVMVLDRTAVILDIFAGRAASREGRLQVELAQLEYLAPRLVGRGKLLSQQVGRIGTRGPGETALEYDRRSARRRITRLKRELMSVRRHRMLHRERRAAVPVPMVSLVGYTNSGKSTLLNALTGAGVFVEDKLFATLDPTVRRLTLPCGREVLVSDTVGFISRLPHELVEAFKSTFEEAASSQILIHVIDGADPAAARQVEVVDRVLSELGMGSRPRIEAINKCDRPEARYRGDRSALRVSALTGAGLGDLVERLERMLREEFSRTRLILPMERGEILTDLYRVGHVISVRYSARGIVVECELHDKHRGRYREFRAG